MIIKETSINWSYSKISDFRRKFANAEEILSEHFMPATILPIPDEIQDEVPRIIVQTKGGHSMLNMALTASSFVTRYTNDYVTNWDLCQRYIKDRTESVYCLLNEMIGGRSKYVGLITKMEYDNPSEDSLQILKNSLLKDEGSSLGTIKDMACKLTYEYNKKFFVNISLQNVREYLSYSDNTIAEEKRHFVGIVLDVNDRCQANSDASYYSTAEAFEMILNITNNLIKNRIEELIKNGTFRSVVE